MLLSGSPHRLHYEVVPQRWCLPPLTQRSPQRHLQPPVPQAVPGVAAPSQELSCWPFLCPQAGSCQAVGARAVPTSRDSWQLAAAPHCHGHERWQQRNATTTLPTWRGRGLRGSGVQGRAYPQLCLKMQRSSPCRDKMQHLSPASRRGATAVVEAQPVWCAPGRSPPPSKPQGHT